MKQHQTIDRGTEQQEIAALRATVARLQTERDAWRDVALAEREARRRAATEEHRR